jgi:Flp pilus assembly protein TadG
MFRMRRCRQNKNRKGAAVVELAVCLPIIVLLVFASIETCNMIFLRQALNASAYEGVRVAVRPDSTNQKVINRCQAVLDGRGLKETAISINRKNVTNVQPGRPIEVTVSAKCDANSMGPSWFFGGRTLEGQASFVKE